MQDIGIGLIGTGFMGKAHALAYRNARAVMGDVPPARLEMLCETPADKCATMASQFGFARATSDWRALVSDPRVDLVCVTTPNKLHHEIVLAALAAGKHVHCEKPLALTLEQARQMEAAARAAGVRTMVGYNYIANPAYTHAARLVAAGEIGDLLQFRGWVDEDYGADPEQPWTWRAQKSEAGLGVLGDLMCHLVSMACGLAGPLDSVLAEMQTLYPTRPLPDGSDRAEVENDDAATALVRFDSGLRGVLMASRNAWGRKSKLGWEIHGSTGMIAFEQERMNELHIYRNRGPKSEQGFATILTGPEHPPYGAFCPAPGHQLGFGDLKVIEAANLLRAIAANTHANPDFTAALHFETAIHAMALSAETGQRVALTQI